LGGATFKHNYDSGCNVFTSSRAIAQAVSRRLHAAVVWVRAQIESYGFVVDKVALRQVFSEYFGFPCQYSFH
jgi:hypothetical protein